MNNSKDNTYLTEQCLADWQDFRTTLQLDYPVWRLNFREYGELKSYDLEQTEATTQWFDQQIPWGDQCVTCGKDAYTCEHYEEPNHE